MKPVPDLPLFFLLTVWSWFSPTAAPPPSQLLPAGCDCCVAAGRTRAFTAADLESAAQAAPAAKEP